MKILVLNAGSSSIKYSLFAMNDRRVLLNGILERIGESIAIHRYHVQDAEPVNLEIPLANHQQALQTLFSTLADSGAIRNGELACIGHRVVHGGELFKQPAVITAEVIEQIAGVIPLAPLHNPANLQGIKESMRLMGNVPQVAVFDTAFHQTLPDYAYRYPLPADLYIDHGVRRYGFHGTSHGYVAKQAADFLGKPLTELNLITLHLGNGASACAIENGRSVDTSMGMTPLEGLMMGTRCGDIDPALHFYLSRSVGLSLEAIETLLNKQSGCKGVCGENDMRILHDMADAGDQTAKLALSMYAYRLKKYIGAYVAVLGRVDAIVFTGGIGENDSRLRRQCCEGLSALGIVIDPDQNQAPDQTCSAIHSTDSTVKILVINTQEELEIAVQAETCLDALR
ncbi:acetate/propionate family kinase [Methylomonas methanica]|uniref:Acetate kinase n=1 Tax=Methylomonas methanica (strain DSM 25384 / MC09) TaxID=857087 RepID=G0A011_METMM|nr:acetate kinase [Methylomonas methanica]AEG01150.1 Acetate kinase [Methylomonas methanica MC09]